MNEINSGIYTEACVGMAAALTKAGIEFTFTADSSFGGGYFRFPNVYPQADIACHYGTYGVEVGLFESFRFPWDNDDVTGWLSPEDFIEKYEEYYEQTLR